MVLLFTGFLCHDFTGFYCLFHGHFLQCSSIIINIIISSSIIAVIIILDIREHNNYAITNIINPSNYMYFIFRT